jgi:hypothetical protein
MAKDRFTTALAEIPTRMGPPRKWDKIAAELSPSELASLNAAIDGPTPARHIGAALRSMGFSVSDATVQAWKVGQSRG